MASTTITTEANHDETLGEARTLLDARISADGWPEGEREKAMGDALNNVWHEGLTVAEWAAAAAARLSA